WSVRIVPYSSDPTGAKRHWHVVLLPVEPAVLEVSARLDLECDEVTFSDARLDGHLQPVLKGAGHPVKQTANLRLGIQAGTWIAFLLSGNPPSCVVGHCLQSPLDVICRETRKELCRCGLVVFDSHKEVSMVYVITTQSSDLL